MLLTPTQVDQRRYIPLGEYAATSNSIVRNSFKAYKSKFWQYRDIPYTGEESFDLALIGSSSFDKGLKSPM